MSKLDHIAEGRAQGLAFALKICKEAQKDGSDPVVALEKEMTYRYKTKIVVLATRKELDQASEQIKAVTIKTVLAACMIVLWEQFGFGGIRLKRLSEAFMTYIRALCEGSVTWWGKYHLKSKCNVIRTPHISNTLLRMNRTSKEHVEHLLRAIIFTWMQMKELYV